MRLLKKSLNAFFDPALIRDPVWIWPKMCRPVITFLFLLLIAVILILSYYGYVLIFFNRGYKIASRIIFWPRIQVINLSIPKPKPDVPL